MSLSSNVTALAIRMAEEINDVRTGGDNSNVVHQNGLFVGVDNRGNTIEYNVDGTVKKITTKSGGTTVSTISFSYSNGKMTSIIQSAGGKTITTTLSYTGDTLTSTSKSVT